MSTGSFLSVGSDCPETPHPHPRLRLQELAQGRGTRTLLCLWAVSFPGLSIDRASPEQPMRSSAIPGWAEILRHNKAGPGDILHDSSVGHAPGASGPQEKPDTEDHCLPRKPPSGTAGSKGSIVFSPWFSGTIVWGVGVHQAAWVPVTGGKAVSSHSPVYPTRIPLVWTPSFSLPASKKSK